MDNLPYIPETITVHIGPASVPGENITVSFPEYLKNVASSELYPTWPENALRANIYAQASFALNRIYTEYYRELGYDFDITNDTMNDQAFVPGRDYFANVSEIVDGIFDSYIRRGNSVVPLFARYCNGTTSVCDGLSQWGSVDLANRGYTPLEILKYYYGDDIVLVENVPVRGITSRLPEINLRLGIISNDVRTIQIRLNRIATNYPAIPKIYQTNGVFGIETLDAVKEFQRIFNLTTDGIVGKETWYAIQRVYNGVKRLNDLVSEGVSYDEIAKQLPDELKLGDSGELVAELQYYLRFVAQYDDAIPPSGFNAEYDIQTEKSVKAFQEQYGLPVTGVMNEKDFAVLFDAYAGIIDSLPESQFILESAPYPGYQLYLGLRGEEVRKIQRYLNYISDTYTDIPKLEEDGFYGENTKEAVSIFQALFSLYVNGIVGAATWGAIVGVYDDLKYGSAVADGQYPGYVLESEQNG